MKREINFDIKKILSAFVLILLTGVLFLSNKTDNKLHIYFCNVGQGDAAYIRFPNSQDMLIDGGKDSSVIDCLSQHMPFYDRQIDVVMLTHPQADHLNGLIDVIKRYRVTYFVSSSIAGDTKGYKELADLITRKKVERKTVSEGSQIEFGNVSFKIIWPPVEMASVLGVQSDKLDINESSVVGLLSYGSFDALFTGDADQKVQENILKENSTLVPDKTLEVLKVAHHGSKASLNTDFLKLFKPDLAIISVGKNSYGHPSEAVLSLLNKLGSRVERTDKEGTVEVSSNGVNYTIENFQ